MTSTDPTPDRSGSRDREASKQALIAAATELLAERGPKDVSVREIARRAGVNHGLVHHYFGSKAGLVTAVLDDLAQRTADLATPDAPGPNLAFFAAEGFDLHLRVLARLLLDGAAPPRFQSAFPFVDHLAGLGRDQYGLDAATAQRRATQAVAMLLGWMMFEPWLISAGGFDAADTERLRAELMLALPLFAAKELPAPVAGPLTTNPGP